MNVVRFDAGWTRFNDGHGPDLFIKEPYREPDGWDAMLVKLTAGSRYRSGTHDFPTEVIILEGMGILQASLETFVEYTPETRISIPTAEIHGFSVVRTDTTFIKRWRLPVGRCTCPERNKDYITFGTCRACSDNYW